MADPTLKQLRYFEALAQHGHFGRAADLCAISQPALSVQIQALEAMLGLPLFERGHRSLHLTEFGERFRPRVQDILRAVDDLTDLARVAQDGLRGLLRIGVIPTVAPYILPWLLRQLSQDFPNLQVRIRETTTKALVDELKDGRIDTAIVALPVSEPSLQEAALISESFVLVRPARDGGLPPPDRHALPDMGLLLLEEGHCFRDQALSFCGVGSPTTASGLDATSLSTLVQMVGAEMGLTLLPEMAVALESRGAAVTVSRFAPPAPTRTIGLIWRKTSPLADRMPPLLDSIAAALARKSAGDLGPSPVAPVDSADRSGA
ncbi:hydrogen peroxide-inducible genes activator [Salipiger sp. IMCC34102]|uniref:hydrogen peroxide-inducible genes activator n=1 Tax=Salipiger sp. IMCC34102 TaxID=2510647 RepID=UPI00101D510D|nr:hydrogen peroxide-inducible genes activator [Salipiger sp. IMCC34102]RYH01170.1 hydrogen peroxide-inducible genes activator [Salipiger sp. IMCC34102]